MAPKSWKMVALSSQPFDNSKFVLDTKEWYGHFLLKKNLVPYRGFVQNSMELTEI